MKINHLIKIFIAIFVSFLLGAISLYLLGLNYKTAYLRLFESIFANSTNFINCIIYSTPFLLTALSFSITAKGGIFNLGVEGAFIISSITTCVVGILFSSLPRFFLISFCIISGIIVSCIYNILIFTLKIKFNTNDIFTMIIFNYIALHFSNFIININGIKSTNGAETSKRIADKAVLTFSKTLVNKFNLPHNFNLTFLVAVLLCIIVYLIFKYTCFGHNIVNIGYNIEASYLSGINVNKELFKAVVLSGSITGLAGSLYILSIGKRISILPMFEGYGFTGILIALFSNSNPIIIIFSSLLFGALKYAGRNLNIVNAPSQVIDLIISSIVLIYAINFTIKKGYL